MNNSLHANYASDYVGKIGQFRECEKHYSEDHHTKTMQANVTRCPYLLFVNIMSNEGWMRQCSRSCDIPHIAWHIDIYMYTQICFLINYVINLFIFVRVASQKTWIWNVPLRHRQSAIEKDTMPYLDTVSNSIDLQNIAASSLTHWGLVTHMCVGGLGSTFLDNGLPPVLRQAIISDNADLLLA